MARSQVSDYFQTGRFTILDVSFSIPMVLLPLFGFKSCSLPSINLDIYKIKEGNYEFPRKVVKGADVGSIMLEQGVQLANSDFWDWCRKAVIGRVPPKTLLLVQFTRMTSLGGKQYNVPGATSTVGTGNLGNFGKGLAGQAVAGNFEFVVRMPGRAWLLKECRPVSYKPGTDFDGLSQDISIAQLELEMEEWEEFSLGL